MALTANPQSALPPQLSWDETIVPALRKRLETESRVLSKRMSVASISSTDEAPQRYQTNGYHHARSLSRPPSRPVESPTPTFDSARQKPSAIPRPSLQHTRTTESASSGHAPPVRRPRTYSTTYLIDTETTNSAHPQPSTSVLPTPASSRSNSPMVFNQASRPSDVKPTRIPKVPRNRSGSASTSGHGHGLVNGNENSMLDARNGAANSHAQYPLTPETSPDLWPLSEGAHSHSSNSNVSVTRAQRPDGAGLMYEPPPFNAASFASSLADDIDTAPNRPSAEEEHPFEHWYRGDLSRNGGVGELRVGNRMEMLEIANYGHKLRPTRIPSVTSSALPGRRKRADSIGARESLYFDDDAERAVTEMVLDEMPLTDMEADTETDRETTYHDAEEDTLRQGPPTTRQRTTTGPSRNPAPSRPPQSTQIPRPAPSTQAQPTKSYTRGASEPPEMPPSQARPRAQGVPQSQSLSSSSMNPQKRGRTKSPVASNKKVKAHTAQQARSKSAFDPGRGPSAEYPQPPEAPGGMADAIPSWTQPVQRSGNWDEVVLPVVARKMGLDDQYEQADGSPRPRRTQERIAPAPGTFGFDHSKYRPPRGDDPNSGMHDVEMDEFGQMPPVDEEHTEAADPNADSSTEREGTRRNLHRATSQRSFHKRDHSPAPFSHYAALPPNARTPEPTAPRQKVDQEVDEESTGCCKCVIM